MLGLIFEDFIFIFGKELKSVLTMSNDTLIYLVPYRDLYNATCRHRL